MENYIVQHLLHYCNISVNYCQEIAPKVISFYDLTFVLSGSMTYTANGCILRLKKNDALFLKPGTLRSRQAGTEPVKYVSFNFQMMPGCDYSLAEYIPNCISAEIRKLISAFPQSHLSPYFHAWEKATNMLNFILFELMDHMELSSTNEHVLKMIRYIDEHITERLTLQQISQHMNLTREYLSFIFHREVGKSLTDFMNERKMRIAKELIQCGEMALTDVARHLGYENYSYFSRLFKRYFDVTPIRLRNMER